MRGGYGIGYERNFGNVTFNVLFNPPQYLVRSIDAPTDVPTMPIYIDNQGPFGGIAGVTKTIPARQPAPRRPEHRDGVQPLLQPVAPARAVRQHRGLVEYTGSRAGSCTTSPTSTSSARVLVYEGIGDWEPGRTRSTRRSTRAATAASRSTTA